MTVLVIILSVLAVILGAGAVGFAWFAATQRRTMRAISALLAEFAAGVNRPDLETVNNLMLPERRESRTLDRFTAEFCDQVERLDPQRTQLTLVRSAAGQPYNALAKVLVRVQPADGAAEHAVFLLARTGRQWRISDWAARADFDLVDYGLS